MSPLSVSYFVVAVNAVLNMLFTLLYELFLCMFDNVQLRELVHTGVEHYVRVIIINKQYSDLTKHSWTGNQIASPSRDLGPLHSRTAVAVCPLFCGPGRTSSHQTADDQWARQSDDPESESPAGSVIKQGSGEGGGGHEWGYALRLRH